MSYRRFYVVLIFILVAVPVSVLYKTVMRVTDSRGKFPQAKVSSRSGANTNLDPAPTSVIRETKNPLPQAPAAPIKNDASADQKKLAKALEFMKSPSQTSSPMNVASSPSSESEARKALREMQKCLRMTLPADKFPPKIKAQVQAAQNNAKARCMDQAQMLIRKFPKLRSEL